MSQKPGKKKGAEKKEKIVVDEQKEPCLRALQKKVRNINKKLTEIEELESKEHLKPEQEEKVSRKQEVLAEKEKYQELIEVYRGVLKDNEKTIRKSQLCELENLAGLIAAREYGADVSESQNTKIDQLVKVLTLANLSSFTLKERVSQISEALFEVAEDVRLKETIRKYLSENQNKIINTEAMSNEPEPRSPRSEKQRENELKEIDEELAEQKKEHEKEEQVEKVEEEVPRSNSVPPVQELTPVQVVSVSNKAESVQEVKDAEQKKPEQKKETPAADPKVESKGENQRKYLPREGREGKGPRGRKREFKEWDPERKPNPKKRYEPKEKATAGKEEAKRVKRSSSSSSLGSTPEARQFKKEEVRELIEDGFIVVGKPKVKAKGKEQQENYSHQHGKKLHVHHHHQKKKN